MAAVGFFVAALLLAVNAVILMRGFADDADSAGAYAYLYGGTGVCLLGALTVLFLLPRWLRQKPWIGTAITCCFGISLFGVFLALLTDIVLGSS